MREMKSFAIKSAGDDTLRFEGYASTWTKVPDSYGDIVAKGAFATSLDEWEASGKVIPVLWRHDDSSPSTFVAKVVEISEDDHGLKVVGEFFTDPDAKKVHDLIDAKVVTEMSFAFDTINAATVTVDGVEVRELRELKLFEVSVVLYGANSDTSLSALKGQVLTPSEIAWIKTEHAKSLASVEGEADSKADDAPEDAKAVEVEGAGKSNAEAVARIKEEINALSGAEMEQP